MNQSDCMLANVTFVMLRVETGGCPDELALLAWVRVLLIANC
jgi:hypothetical protein